MISSVSVLGGMPQAGLLGASDELTWSHHSAGRMFPTNERFHSHDLVAGQRDDRLVVDAQLIVGQRPPQCLLGLHPLKDLGMQDLVEQLCPGPAPLLGPVHGDVGVPEDVLRLADAQGQAAYQLCGGRVHTHRRSQPGVSRRIGVDEPKGGHLGPKQLSGTVGDGVDPPHRGTPRAVGPASHRGDPFTVRPGST